MTEYTSSMALIRMIDEAMYDVLDVWDTNYRRMRDHFMSTYVHTHWEREPRLKAELQAPNLVVWTEYREFEGTVRTKEISMKLGRFLLKLAKDSNATIADAAIERMVNRLKAQLNATNLPVDIVKGEALREAYLEDNYSREFPLGEMGSSCMRYDRCQDYLDIYVHNPNNVSLAVVRDGEGMVIGRAIVWTDQSGTRYLDRAYGTEIVQNIFRNWASEHGIDDINNAGYGPEISLAKGHFSEYPYMDTMKYLNERNGVYSVSSSETGDTIGTMEGLYGDLEGYETCDHCESNRASRYSSLCDECEEYTSCCDHCGDRENNDDLHSVGHWDHVCTYCYENHYERCEDCEEVESNDNVFYDEEDGVYRCECCHDAEMTRRDELEEEKARQEEEAELAIA